MYKQIVNFPLYFINELGTSVIKMCKQEYYKKIGSKIYRRSGNSAKFKIEMDADKYIELDGLIYRKLKIATNTFGYKFVKLPDSSGKHTLYIHRLVYRTFVGVIPPKFEINHIDHDKSNNSVSNLELVTHSENLEKSVIYHGGKLKPRCKCCGKKLESNSKSVYCLNCNRKLHKRVCNYSTRKFEHPSKELLWKLIKTMSFVEIGKMYGVTDNAIRRVAKNYGLPFRRRDIERQKENENRLLDSHCIGEG